MREKAWRGIAIGALVVLGIYVVVSQVHARVETIEAESDAKQLAEPLDKLCKQDAQARKEVGSEKCSKADEVQSQPDVPIVIEGEKGEKGDPGRGIRGTRIERGKLIVAYTDGTDQNVGTVIGANGADGEQGEKGEQGRGIASTEIVAGQLQVNYTDGETILLGTVVGEDGADGQDGQDGADGEDGAPGRGIANTESIDGRLIITYTDGSQEDVGPLPQGPRGEPGADGPPGPTCPEGTTLEQREVTRNTLPPAQETWFVCVQNEG